MAAAPLLAPARAEPATADARIVTAEEECERAVLIGIVECYSPLGMLSYGGQLTEPERRGPHRGPERQQNAELLSIATGSVEDLDDLQSPREIRHRFDIRPAHERFHAGFTQVGHSLLPHLASNGVVRQNLNLFSQSLAVK